MNKLRSRFKLDASFVLCALAKLEETAVGLTLRYSNKSTPLAAIVDHFCSAKCMDLFGKPKLFFFLEERTTNDGIFHTKVCILSDSYIQNNVFWQQQVEELFSNLHAGVCCFIGAGTRGPKGCSIVERVAQKLITLKTNPGQSLQSALIEMMRVSATEDHCIKPQLLTTLPLLIDFPDLEVTYVDKFRRNSRLYKAGSFFSPYEGRKKKIANN
jgi:hypothetical protein